MLSTTQTIIIQPNIQIIHSVIASANRLAASQSRCKSTIKQNDPQILQVVENRIGRIPEIYRKFTGNLPEITGNYRLCLGCQPSEQQALEKLSILNITSGQSF